MPKRPLLSIVIPTRNEEKYLPRLLYSIERQDLYREEGNIEVIVADDFSKDNTREIACAFGCNIVGGGFPDTARNNGAGVANSNLLLFLDADTLLPRENFLRRALREINSKGADVAGALLKPTRTTSPRENFLHEAFYAAGNIGMILGQRTRNPFMQACMFAKKNVHMAVGGFPPYWFGEDSAYAKNAVELGYRFELLRDCGKVLISPRRLQKKGFWNAVREYIGLNAKRIMGKEFVRGQSEMVYWNRCS